MRRRNAAHGPSRQAAFFGPTVANGALRTWLDLRLAPPSRDGPRADVRGLWRARQKELA